MFSASALALLTFVFVSSVNFMEQQTTETIEAEVKGLIEQDFLYGVEAVRDTVTLRSQHDPDRRSFYLLVRPDGRPVAGNLVRWPETPPEGDGSYRLTLQLAHDTDSTERHRVIARPVALRDGYRLLVGRDIEDKRRTEHLLRNAIFLGAGMMLLLGVVGGFAMSRWTTSRLEHINRATAAVMAGHLGRRVQLDGGGDEFDELAANLNAMLERIERLVAGMREVTDNVAHDLRTPLTRLRSRIEVALLHGPGREEARELLEATMRDADALIATFNALLNIARAESGAQRSEWERVDLAELARDVFDLYEPLAEEKAIELAIEPDGPVEVLGNRQLLAQAMANLVDNAVKYTPSEGHVRIATGSTPAPFVTVTDDGPGIPEESHERALQRFVRLHGERTTPGNGLGLSLVLAVARLHDATLELADAGPGLKVRLTLPPPVPGADAA
ncbi:sensor histidine kinase [Marinimicrococcus flavescens]|uniref:histidine kinase n=1 Tax=Marinimicrococcus flavescens TaxID=3031815 RepID=A0AAP3XSM2_9PROT|nr:HAMP domain-containing sensor histidine kinase [Marinimicrococcus flavescens]